MEEKKTISELYADIDRAKERIKSLNEEKEEIEKGMCEILNQIWLQRSGLKDGERKFKNNIGLTMTSPSKVSRR